MKVILLKKDKIRMQTYNLNPLKADFYRSLFKTSNKMRVLSMLIPYYRNQQSKPDMNWARWYTQLFPNEQINSDRMYYNIYQSFDVSFYTFLHILMIRMKYGEVEDLWKETYKIETKIQKEQNKYIQYMKTQYPLSFAISTKNILTGYNLMSTSSISINYTGNGNGNMNASIIMGDDSSTTPVVGDKIVCIDEKNYNEIIYCGNIIAIDQSSTSIAEIHASDALSLLDSDVDIESMLTLIENQKQPAVGDIFIALFYTIGIPFRFSNYAFVTLGKLQIGDVNGITTFKRASDMVNYLLDYAHELTGKRYYVEACMDGIQIMHQINKIQRSRLIKNVNYTNYSIHQNINDMVTHIKVINKTDEPKTTQALKDIHDLNAELQYGISKTKIIYQHENFKKNKFKEDIIVYNKLTIEQIRTAEKSRRPNYTLSIQVDNDTPSIRTGDLVPVSYQLTSKNTGNVYDYNEMLRVISISHTYNTNGTNNMQIQLDFAIPRFRTPENATEYIESNGDVIDTYIFTPK